MYDRFIILQILILIIILIFMIFNNYHRLITFFAILLLSVIQRCNCYTQQFTLYPSHSCDVTDSGRTD